MYNKIIEGIFLERTNRFIAKVLINEKVELVHVKNTGRCVELFVKGTKCYLELSTNPNRKTKYTLISIYKNEILINIDSQIPNKVVYDGILNGEILSELEPIFVEREKQYKKSRFDIKFFSNKTKRYYYLEVKGVTLENNKIAKFPDAPTSRGSKHILELIDASRNGFGAIIFFLIQFQGAKIFIPNNLTDPEFAKNLEKAYNNNVEIIAYDSIVEKEQIYLNNKIKVEI